MAGANVRCRRPTGEVGILRDVSRDEVSNKYLFLTIDHETLEYVGVMYVHATKFRDQIYTLLRSKVGHSISGIGDMELFAGFNSSPA
jgi:hypothetical protein